MTEGVVLGARPYARPGVMKVKIPGRVGLPGEATPEFRQGVATVRSGVETVIEGVESIEGAVEQTSADKLASQQARASAIGAASTATTASETAVTQAAIATEGATTSTTQASLSTAARAAADAAADSALRSAEAARISGRIYPTIAEGEAATPVGEYFNVEAPSELDAVDYRLRTSTGSTLRKTIPSSQRVEALKARKVIGSGLVTGGGDLSADRTLAVPAATAEEVAAGTVSTSAVVPATLKPTVDNLKAETSRVEEAALGFPSINDVYADGETDAAGRIMLGYRYDGVVDISETYALLNNRYRYGELFADGSVMWGIGHDGLFYAPETAPFINSEWLYADLCEDGVSVWRGVRFDGTSYPPSSAAANAIAAWTNGAEVNVLKNGRRVQLTYGTPAGTVNVSPTATASKATYLIDNGSTVTLYEEDLLCATSLTPTVTRLFHFIGFGQSNRDGVGSPATHKTAVNPGRAVMFNAGDKVRGSDDAEVPLNRDHIVFIVDAYEIVSSESPSMGFVWGITQPGRLATTDGALISSHAMGGQPFSAIRKGGTRPVIWNNLMVAQKRARIMAAANGLPYVPFLHVTHGEADRAALAGVYGGNMLTLWDDCLADFGVPTKIVMSQMGAFTAYGLTTSEVPLDQLSVALLYPEKFGCSGPQYTLQRNVDDGIHIIKQSRQGSYDARTADRMLKGLDARPLHATGLVKSSATVYRLPMYVPVGALTLDTTTVSDPGNYGISWNQTGGTARTISSVAISGNDIVVTLSGDPGAFTAAHIGIALYGAVDAHAGPTTGARSCFRDQATDLDIDGVPMPNWACHQRITVPLS